MKFGDVALDIFVKRDSQQTTTPYSNDDVKVCSYRTLL